MRTDFDINFQECLSPLCSYIMETEGYVTVQSTLPSNHSTDLMISIKSVCNNLSQCLVTPKNYFYMMNFSSINLKIDLSQKQLKPI